MNVVFTAVAITARQLSKAQAYRELKAPPDAEAAPSIPEYSADNGLWITFREAAAIEGVSVSSLATNRKRYNAIYFAPDDMSGIDEKGRMWRHIGTPGSRVSYYKPSLTRIRAPEEFMT